MYADHHPSAPLIFTHVGLVCLQYLEIEVKNPRTHIENEKALYTDYEIEVKVSLSHSILYCIVAGRVKFTGQLSHLPQIRGLKFLVYRYLVIMTDQD